MPDVSEESSLDNLRDGLLANLSIFKLVICDASLYTTVNYLREGLIIQADLANFYRMNSFVVLV